MEAAPKQAPQQAAQVRTAEVLVATSILDERLDSEAVGLPTRIYGPLYNANIETVEQLICRSEQELLDVPGIGPQALIRIRQFTDAHELKLKGDE